MGIFSDVHTEIGQIIVAQVNKERVAELLKPDRVLLSGDDPQDVAGIANPGLVTRLRGEDVFKINKALCRQFLRERQVGYEAVKHQRFVETGSFDSVQQVMTSGTAFSMALHGPAEEEQFTDDASGAEP